MKTWKVYELINSMGTVEWVGETYRPEYRMCQHIKWKSSNGKFYGRQDLIMNIVAEFNNRKEARNLEGQLKLEYGLEWTERTSLKHIHSNKEHQSRNGKINGSIVGAIYGKINGKINGKIGGPKSQAIERNCTYCSKTIKGSTYFRYHGDKCKQKFVSN